MKKNMGTADRITRIIIAVIVVALFAGNVISGVLATILLLLAGIFVVTSFVSFCPIYAIVGLRTCSVEEKE